MLFKKQEKTEKIDLSNLEKYASEERKRSTFKNLLYLSVIAVSLFSGSYLYSIKQDKILQEKNTIIVNLERENSFLKKQNKGLEEFLERSVSEEEYSVLERRNKNLSRENEKLRVLTKDYERRIQELRREKESLEEKLKEQKEKNQELENTIISWEKKYSILTRQNENLEENIKKILEENEILKEQNSVLEEKLKLLERKLSEQKKEYNILLEKYGLEIRSLKAQIEEKEKNNTRAQVLYEIVNELKIIFSEEKKQAQYTKGIWNIKIQTEKNKTIIEYTPITYSEKNKIKIILYEKGYKIYGAKIEEGLKLAYDSLFYALKK